MRFGITTPIYYVNSTPHIGTAASTLAADVTARYQKMHGKETFFLTGTDENGQKVLEAATQAGRDPHAFVDDISQRFVEVWRNLNIEYDDFIRTTEPRHVAGVQAFFKVLQETGNVYTGKYEGWYDVSSETYYKESDLVDGKSPDGNEVRWVSEENYFFRLSAFGERLLQHIEANPQFLIPEIRKNEVVSFIKQGLRDVCISRNNNGWGIPVPGDSSQVIYVWFDALINYITAAGWPEPGWEERWPAEVEWMAKDIFTRFHATLWPAMLMGANLPLPKTLIGHAWILFGGEKISKSKGNAVTPAELISSLKALVPISDDLATDACRFAIASFLSYDSDSTFSMDEFYRRYNAQLANDLGNVVNRTLAMTNRFLNGEIPKCEVEPAAREALDTATHSIQVAYDEYRIDRALAGISLFVSGLNGYIDSRAPWALAKAESPELPAVMRSLLVSLRTIEGAIRPIMPAAADSIAHQLNLPPMTDWKEIGTEGSVPGGKRVGEPIPMFPRIDLNAVKPQPSLEEKKMNSAIPEPKPAAPTMAAAPDQITIEDFAKVQLRVARIVEAEPLEGSDKLMKLQVAIAEEKRQIIAGIRKNYAPEDLIGRQIVVVANLKPAKLRGAESQGMLLAATDEEGGAILLEPDKEAPEGARVK